MTTARSAHRPAGTVIVDRQDGTRLKETTKVSLTETRAAIRRARSAADTFHTYDIAGRDGTRLHIAYAHYNPGTLSGPTPFAMTSIWEVPAQAVLDSFGLLPLTTAA